MRRYIIPAALALMASSAVAIAQNTDKIMPPAPMPPTHQEQRFINVSGECVRNVMPDRGLITATANYQHPKSVQEASKFVMTQYEQLNTAVKAMGLKDLNIQTSDYNVTPIYQWVQPEPNKPGKQVLQGYQARLGLSIKTSSIDKLGDVIAKAGEIGITEVGGFQLMLSDEQSRQIRSDCLSEAVSNARTKADKMVTAAGAKLGPVYSISEFSAPMPYAQPVMARMEMKTMAAADGGMPAPSIQAGSTSIQVNVNTTFRID